MASKIQKICSLWALTIVAVALAAFTSPAAAQFVYWTAFPNTTSVTLKENGQSALVTYTFTNVSPYDLFFIQTAPSLNYVAGDPTDEADFFEFDDLPSLPAGWEADSSRRHNAVPVPVCRAERVPTGTMRACIISIRFPLTARPTWLSHRE